MNDKEKIIKEQRTVEATRKRLMGFDGKIGCIVRNMGQPIISQSQGGTYFNSTPGYDFYDVPDDREFWQIEGGLPEDICNQIPVLDIDGVEQPEGGEWMERPPTIPESTEMMGWHFDGLGRGIHMEIQYMEDNKELLLRYKGTVVYREIAGDLESYVPSDEWEDKVDQLSKVAQQIQIKQNSEDKNAKKKEFSRQKENWLRKMKNKWGF